jgi:hypothetical protein
LSLSGRFSVSSSTPASSVEVICGGAVSIGGPVSWRRHSAMTAVHHPAAGRRADVS